MKPSLVGSVLGVGAALLLSGLVGAPAHGGEGELLCFDNAWGSLFAVDPQTGHKRLLSGHGFGADIVGEGPIWPGSVYSGFDPVNQMLPDAAGRVYLSRVISDQDLGHGLEIYCVDPKSGDRQRWWLSGRANPDDEYDLWRTQSYAVLPDPEVADHLYVVRMMEWLDSCTSRFRAKRVVELLDTATGELSEVDSALTIPYRSCPSGGLRAGYVGSCRFEPSGRLLRIGPDLLNPPASAFYVHADLQAEASQMTDTSDMFATAMHVDTVGNRVYAGGQFTLRMSEKDGTGQYGPMIEIADRSVRDITTVHGTLYAIDDTQNLGLERIDPATGAVTLLPKAQPVGPGFAAPDQALLSAPNTLLSAEENQLVWRNFMTGEAVHLPADCPAGSQVIEETATHVYYWTNNQVHKGFVYRADKDTGVSEPLLSSVVEGAALVDEQTLAYLHEDELLLYSMDTGQTERLVATDGPGLRRPLRRGEDGKLYTVLNPGSHSSRVLRVDAQGRQEAFARIDGWICDFVHDPATDTVYFVDSTRYYSLYASRLDVEEAWLVSGQGDPYGDGRDPWLGAGPIWGSYAGPESSHCTATRTGICTWGIA